MYTSADFKKFIKEKAVRKDLTFADLAKAIGILPSHFSELLNGKRKMDPGTINKIADVLGILRTEIYEKAGWVDLTSNEKLVQRFREASHDNKQIAKLFKAIMALEEPERSERIRMILAAWGR
jgi:transcriptional regulator with XRE-family HTH domain